MFWYFPPAVGWQSRLQHVTGIVRAEDVNTNSICFSGRKGSGPSRLRGATVDTWPLTCLRQHPLHGHMAKGVVILLSASVSQTQGNNTRPCLQSNVKVPGAGQERPRLATESQRQRRGGEKWGGGQEGAGLLCSMLGTEPRRGA